MRSSMCVVSVVMVPAPGWRGFAVTRIVRRQLTLSAAILGCTGGRFYRAVTGRVSAAVERAREDRMAQSAKEAPKAYRRSEDAAAHVGGLRSQGSASPGPPAGPGRRVIEDLGETECLRLLGAGRVGRLAYTGRQGLTVLPVVYKLHEGSIIFHTVEGTFTEDDLRTGITHADYQVAFEIDQIDPDARGGWAVLVVGSAHHVDTEAERMSIIKAGADPWPWAEAEAVHLIRVQPRYIHGRRSYPA